MGTQGAAAWLPVGVAALSALAWLSACGARTALEDDGAARGGSAAQGGGSPQGGAVPVDPCDAILETGAPTPIALDPVFGMAFATPRLVPHAEGLRLYLRELGTDAVRYPVFDPLASWPPALNSPFAPTTTAFAMVAGGGPLGTGILGESATSSLHFMQDETNLGFAIAADGNLPRFLTSGAERWLAGYELPSFASELRLASFLSSDTAATSTTVGCASSAMFASAIPDGDGFTVALSNAVPFGACVDGPVSVATRLQIVRVDAALVGTTENELTFSEPLALVALAPRSGGAWLVARTDGSTSEAIPAALAYRLDTNGQVVGEPARVIEDGDGPSAVAIAAVGDRLAVAHLRPTATGGFELAVQLVQPDGSLGRTLTRDVDADGSDEITLSSTADGDIFVVGWRSPLSDGGTTITLARYGCVTGAL